MIIFITISFNKHTHIYVCLCTVYTTSWKMTHEKQVCLKSPVNSCCTHIHTLKHILPSVPLTIIIDSAHLSIRLCEENVKWWSARIYVSAGYISTWNWSCDKRKWATTSVNVNSGWFRYVFKCMNWFRYTNEMLLIYWASWIELLPFKPFKPFYLPIVSWTSVYTFTYSHINCGVFAICMLFNITYRRNSKIEFKQE